LDPRLPAEVYFAGKVAYLASRRTKTKSKKFFLQRLNFILCFEGYDLSYILVFFSPLTKLHGVLIGIPIDDGQPKNGSKLSPKSYYFGLKEGNVKIFELFLSQALDSFGSRTYIYIRRREGAEKSPEKPLRECSPPGFKVLGNALLLEAVRERQRD
jgi:hypothetical protein